MKNTIRSLRIAVAMVLAATATPALAAPHTFDAAQAWRDFLAKPAAYDKVNEAYHVLGEVNYTVDSIDADACRAKGDVLAQALAVVPVGIALRHAALLCADALDDTARADEQMQAIASLIRLAREESGEGAWPKPMRIVRPEDVRAFLHAAGYEPRYGYFQHVRPNAGFGWTVAIRESATSPEKHLAFDWVDTMARMGREGDYAGYPMDRAILLNAFLDNWPDGEDIDWIDARTVRDAIDGDDVAKGLAMVRGAAARGGLMSAMTWIETCRAADARRDCADGLVDALLPAAESGQGLARAILALAYHEGIGIARDEKAARTLVEAADADWEGLGASRYFANYLLAKNEPWPAWLVERMAASDLPCMRALTAVGNIMRNGAASAADVAALEAPANNATGRGLYVLSQLPKEPRAAGWLERAAAAGSVEARSELALSRLEKSGADPEARAMLEEAARAGDAQAALSRGYLATLASDYKAAERWWLGAATAGNVMALRAVADLYSRDIPGLLGDSRQAYSLYETLAAEDAGARRDFATLLLHHPRIPHEPERARKLLQQDAESGDAQSQIALAGALAAGAFGKPAPAEAKRWFEKAVASGRPDAKSDFGMWLYRNESSDEGRRRGLAMVTEAADAGVRLAINNVAWVRCVTPYPELRDAAAGLEAARRLGDIDLLAAGLVDTVAACHAAAGDFDRAVELQGRAVAQVEALADGKETLERMKKRLALYAAHQPYIERSVDE